MHKEVVFEMSSGKIMFVEWPESKTEMSANEVLHEIKDSWKNNGDLFYCTELDFYRKDSNTVLVNKNNIEKIWVEEY